MLTRLIDAGVPAPVIVSGLIWGLWHVPLIVAGIIYGAHPSTALAVGVFMVSATSAGVIIARFRLDTGSTWPPIAFHAAYNSVIQTAFTPATAGPDAPLWVEEAGILVAVTLVLVAVLFSLGRWRMLRWPGAVAAASTCAGTARR
jgi:membrane protease YdiL (CAAX protease family)